MDEPKSQIRTVERLDAEMSAILGRLASMGMDQAAANTTMLAAAWSEPW